MRENILGRHESRRKSKNAGVLIGLHQLSMYQSTWEHVIPELADRHFKTIKFIYFCGKHSSNLQQIVNFITVLIDLFIAIFWERIR